MAQNQFVQVQSSLIYNVDNSYTTYRVLRRRNCFNSKLNNVLKLTTSSPHHQPLPNARTTPVKCINTDEILVRENHF